MIYNNQFKLQRMKSIDPYTQFFSDPCLPRLAESASPRLLLFFHMFSQFFLTHINLNRVDHIYEKTLEKMLRSIYYNKIESQGPSCSKKISKYYICQDCAIHSTKGCSSICFCTDCFNTGEHPGHNFRVITSSIGVCDCGDGDSVNFRSNCRKHVGEQRFLQPCIPEVDSTIFIKEMSFIFHIYLSLVYLRNNVLDEHRKKEILGLAILKKITDFIRQSYINKVIVGELLSTRLAKGNSCIEEILKCSQMTLFLDKFCGDLLLQLSNVAKVKELVITHIFLKTASPNQYLKDTDSIFKVGFQFLSCGSNIVSLLQTNKIPPLTINCKHFQTFFDKCHAYSTLYRNFLKMDLSGQRYASKIIELTFSRVNICTFFNVASLKEQKIHKSLIVSLDGMYLTFLLILMKTLKQIKSSKPILSKIIKDTFNFLVQKKQSISMAAERTFALALFIYFDCQIENIYDLVEDRLFLLFGMDYDTQEELFMSYLTQLIQKFLYLMKMEVFNEYQKDPYKEKNSKDGQNKIIVSIDYLYARILLMLMIKIDRPTYDQPIPPLQKFLAVRKNGLESLFEMYLEDDLSKMQDTMMVLIYQINLMISTFINIGQSQIGDVILCDYLDSPNKAEIFELYKMLHYMNSDLPPKQFKKLAEKYIPNQSLIETFIKEQLAIYSQKIKNGEIPPNKFNLSFNSSFVSPSSSKEYGNLYYIKLKNRRITEFSRYLFSRGTVHEIVEVQEWIFQLYEQFKDNQVQMSQIIMLGAFQTMITLYLQTLSPKAKKLIEKIIEGKTLNISRSEYHRQILEIYQSNQKKIREEKSRHIERERENRGHEERRLKKIEKLKQLKITQTNVLAKINSNPEIRVEEREQVHPSTPICIVCRHDGSERRLNYLCRCRYSNFLPLSALNEKRQLMLITTCGHTIHQECLNQNIEEDQLIDDFQCFLCKSLSNCMVPFSAKPTRSQSIEFIGRLFMKQCYVLKPLLRSKGVTLSFDLVNPHQYMAKICQSLIYQLHSYSVYYSKYFLKKMLPIMQQIITIFKSYGDEDISKILNSINLPKNNRTMRYSFLMLNYLIFGERVESFSLAAQSMKKFCLQEMKNDKKMTTNQIEYAQKHINLINLIASHIEDRCCYKLETLPSLLEDGQLPPRMFKLPQDLLDLNKEVGFCKYCKLMTSKIIICLLCSLRMCQDCLANIGKKHLVEVHNGESVMVQVQTGDCLYQTGKHSIYMPSTNLYLNYIGEPIPTAKTFPQRGQYKLNRSNLSAVMEDILNDQIDIKMHEISPDRCDVQ